MLSNIDYEVCALIILIMILALLKVENNVRTFSNKIFLFIVIFGIFDVFLDIISTVMVSFPKLYPAFWQDICLWVFYAFQLLLPFTFFLYVTSLHNSLKKKSLPVIFLCSIFFIIMTVILITNKFTGLLFSFDSSGTYVRGPFYPFIYIYGLIYMIIVLIDAYIHKKFMQKKYFIAIIEFMIINIVTVLVQFFRNDILLTGLGIAIALIALLITVNNPYEMVDSLTGLFDASGLKESLTHCYNMHSGVCHIIVIACDNVKRINLVFGFEEGSKQIKAIADMLKKSVGKKNAFRFVGDRFVLLCHDDKQYSNAVENIKTYFSKPHKINGIDAKLSACVCCIPNPQIHKTPEKLLDFLDYIVGRAKKMGNGTLLYVDREIEAQYFRRRKIEEYLYKAVEQKLFEVYFQPIYSTKSGCFESAEILVRLRHPTLGMISPSEFIPIAESNGEINQVQNCILHKACEFINEWPEILTKINYFKFNMSPAIFLNTNLSEDIIKIIKSYDISPSVFQFEITETTATVYEKELMLWVKNIKNEGAGLCLDDFGSGFANLNVIMKLPFDVIKIDRSMLIDALLDKKSKVLYESIVKMIRHLGFTVVSEGAETEEDIEFLHSINVDCIQGYYYSKPLPPDDFVKLIL